MFSEIRLIWICKSHAFDLGKVGRYILVIIMTNTGPPKKQKQTKNESKSTNHNLFSPVLLHLLVSRGLSNEHEL